MGLIENNKISKISKKIEQFYQIFADSINYASFLTHTTRHFLDKSLKNSILLKPLK